MENNLQTLKKSNHDSSLEICQSESIWDQNHLKFKRIFQLHSSGDKLSYQEFIKFCKLSSLIPDLLTVVEGRHLYNKYIIDHKLMSKSEVQPILSLTQFEELLQNVASHIDKSSKSVQEKINELLIHMKKSVRANYRQNLITLRVSDSEINSDVNKSKASNNSFNDL